MAIGAVEQNQKFNSGAAAHKIEISLLSVFFCIAVIVIHLLSEAVSNLSHTSAEWSAAFVFQRILFCAVYGFIFLSAEKTALNADKNGSVIKFYQRRIIKIVLPYIIAVLVYYVFLLSTDAVNFSLRGLLIHIITGNLAAHFYFVPVIVQFYILTPIFKRVFEMFSAKTILSAALVLNLAASVFLCRYGLYSCIFLKYLLCYTLGYYAGKNYDKFVKIKDRFKLLLCVFLVALCAELAAAYAVALGYAEVTALQQAVTALYMPIAVTFWYAVMTYLAGVISGKTSALTEIVSRGSYYIYLWHVLFIMFADILLQRLGISDIFLRFLSRGVLTLICAACIPAFSYFKQRVKREG